ncbi:mucin-5AC-like isoform X2 [Hyla sarda]|nr:mucin-5AC-like isoform X2 [Hyla sarda]
MTNENNIVLYTNVTLKIDEILVHLFNGMVLVQGEVVQLPHSVSTVVIQTTFLYTQVSSSIGLMFKKYHDGSFELQLDSKYINQTCGLCGSLMGIGVFDLYDIPLTETEFGNLQKADGPNENCPDATPANWSDCSSKENEAICEVALTSNHFENCHPMIAVEPYIEACRQDLCRCKAADRTSCICSTVAEYSHQCILHRGQPQNWRSSDFCYKSCPSNMLYRECGSPCMKSCSDPERHLVCDEHCVEGCYCPPGYIFDDVGSNECIRIEECPCSYNGNIYQPGESYSTSCRTCSCFGGKWNCSAIPCSATCSIEGGSHITTFDQFRYNMHGDCHYVISKDCRRGLFTILGELRHCGLRQTEACLKGVTIFLNNASTKLEVIKPSQIFVNGMMSRLPIYSVSEKYIIFQPSPFYIVVKSTSIGLLVVVQILPIMQLYVILQPAFKTKTCGLCGNFNSIQNDDFRSISGIIEGTASAFVNTWRLTSDCPNIRDIIDDPCTLGVESAEYARHWCGQLLDRTGVFSDCHSLVDPEIYYKNCLMDTCSCDKSEDCMCAALFSYYKICAARGIIITDWQTNVCSQYPMSCPKTQIYSYKISSCLPSCRSLSEPDILCRVLFDPLIGCTCKKGFYLNENGKCIPASLCPCYYRGNEIPPDQSITDNGILCTCNKGKLNCLTPTVTECKHPMTLAICNTRGSTGTECAKSCQTLDMQCYSTRCVPGCICPPGLLSDGRGGCIEAESCPCIHNGVMYNPGETIQVRCNTCVCEKRKWKCTNSTCLATCTIYGDGHYITFDGKRYIFTGECQYTLSQDHCSLNDNGTFRIITENVPCGTTGMTCSKSIKVFLGSYEFILVDDHLNVAQRGSGDNVPYKVRLMGIYLVIETQSGLLLLWDKKTSIFIKVTSEFRGKLCGLCGNYDGNAINDFTTRNNAIVGNIEEFGNSWKLVATCPDAKVNRDPCSLNPYRVSWAQKQCSVIGSEVFSACHPHVDPFKYYEACVTDTCACNTGGDCECLCTAIAAYAQACGEFGICVSWRTPNLCPLFCDYYNEDNGCQWHYKPCGAPCMKTCRNPSGKCNYLIRGLEGCYPHCPPDKPYFDEDEMQCVAVCGCYDEERKHYKLGAEVPSGQNCYICTCTMDGINCVYDVYACICTYEGNIYKYNEVVYNITSIEGCVSGICKENGTILREVYPCPTATQVPHTTVLTKTTTLTTTRSTVKTIPTTTRRRTTTIKTSLPTTPCQVICKWTEYFSLHTVTLGNNGGDFENLDIIRRAGFKVCANPKKIECRPKDTDALTQIITCSLDDGLICQNKHQITNFKTCYDYEIRYKCCQIFCKTTSIKTTSPKTTTPTTRSQGTKTLFTSPTKSLRSTSPKLRTSTFKTKSTSNLTGYPVTCTPRCYVSEWISVNEPESGEFGGEYENFELLKAAGKKVCYKPVAIECRIKGSDKNPSIFEEMQEITCDLQDGLKCLNAKQTSKQCYDYEIQYICCDDVSHCRPTTTTICSCNENGSVFKPGDTISSTTDPSGCIISKICSQNCKVTTLKSCPTTSSATTTLRITSSTTSPITKTTKTTVKTSTVQSTTVPFTFVTLPKTTMSTTRSTILSFTTPKTTIKSSPTATTASAETTTQRTTVSTPKTSFKSSTRIKTTRPSTTASTKTTRSTTVTTPKTSIRTRTTTKTTRPSTTALTKTTRLTTVTISKRSPRTRTTIETTLPSTTASTQSTLLTTVTIMKTSPKTRTTIKTTPSTTASTKSTLFTTVTSPKTSPRTETTTKTSRQSTTASTRSTLLTTVTISKTSPRTRTTTKTTRPSTAASTKSTLFTTVTSPKTSRKTRTTTKTTRPSTAASTKSTLFTTVTSPKTSRKTRTTTKTTRPSTAASTKSTLFTTVTSPKTSRKTRTTTKTTRPSTAASTKSTLFTTVTSPKTSRKTRTTIKTTPSTTASTKSTLFTTVTSPKTSPRTGTTTKTMRSSRTALTGTTRLSTETTSKTSTKTGTTTKTTRPSTTPPTKTTRLTTVSTTKTSLRTTSSAISTFPSTTASTKATHSTTVTTPTTSLRSTSTTPSTLPSSTALKTTTLVTTPEISTKTATTTKSTPPTTTIISSTTVKTETTQFTTLHGCSGRKVNETWLTDNCTYATCLGNNVIVLKNVTCPPITTESCANGVKPTVIYSDDGCCIQKVCECICSGWGGRFFVTFDGTSYSYQDTCTNVLVKEINQTYGNFSVLLDKSNCSTPFNDSCELTLLVQYKGYDVKLTQKRGVTMAFFNSVNVYPVFIMDDIVIYGSFEKMVVSITTIDAYISLTSTLFEIKLSSTLFKNNTEGQCGTCSNNREDDCRLPDGTIISDCSSMASYWKVDSLSKLNCGFVTSTPSTRPLPSLTTFCPFSSICTIISSNVFDECHKIVPYEVYLKQCFASHCDKTTFCDSVKAYAAKCINYGKCTDWRKDTECSYNCPDSKVYKACSNIQQPTCSSRIPPNIPNFIGDVCVCPNNTILSIATQDICVPQCGCVGPNGELKKPNDSWIVNCSICTCIAITYAVQCRPIQCPPLVPPPCDKIGFILVQVQDPANPCCQKIICEPDNVCVVNNTIYKPGAIIPPSYDNPCYKCNCTSNKDPLTKLNAVNCVTKTCKENCKLGFERQPARGHCCYCVQVACIIPLPNGTLILLQANATWYPSDNKCLYYECQNVNGQFVVKEKHLLCTVNSQSNCSLGFIYKEINGQCCGNCLRVNCTLNMPDKTIKTLQPGETWSPPGDSCTKYNCTSYSELITEQITCQPFDSSTCEKGLITTDKDGCCQICTAKQESKCIVHGNVTILQLDNCKSLLPVNATYCEGTCTSKSMYSFANHKIEEECACCVPTKTREANIFLECKNGTSFNYKYSFIEECDCSPPTCRDSP